MKEPKDLTNELKVIGVTLMTKEQADRTSVRLRTSSAWLLRSSVKDVFWKFEEQTVAYATWAGTLGGWGVNNPQGVRPVLVSPNLSSLDIGKYWDERGRRVFRYKGLEWMEAAYSESGCDAAFCADVLKDENGKDIRVPFRDCDYTAIKKKAIGPDGRPIAWNDLPNFSHSTVKQFLDKWAKENGIINQEIAGVPYNSTNGTAIESIFSNVPSKIVWEEDIVQVYFEPESPTIFSLDWWNAPCTKTYAS